GRGRGQADRVRGADDLAPLRGGDAAGGDAGPHRVVEDLRAGPGQGAEARVLQLLEVGPDAHAGEPGAVLHLLRGEGVEVELGRGRLPRAAEVGVEVRVHARREAGLEADLGGAQVPGLDGAAHHLLAVEEVALLRAVVAGEGAERARLHADV